MRLQLLLLRQFNHSTRSAKGQQPKEGVSLCQVMPTTTSFSPTAKQRAVTRPMPSTLSFGSWASPAGRPLYIHTTVLACPSHPSVLYYRYDNRATDLTKDGMRQGIEDAAAFLVFLSEGVLDRPFCEWHPFLL
jgi:hypothetical protein